MSTESYSVTGLFEGKTLSELKEASLAKLKQAPGNYGRYSSDVIADALDFAQIRAAVLTQCLKSFAIIEMKDGYSQYKPPTQMLLPVEAFFYQSATSYTKLEQKPRRWLDKFRSGWRTNDGDPLYMYMGDNYGNLRKLGFTPTPDTDGTSYTVSPDTGVYVSESGMTTSGNVTGTNSAASATVCTDTAGRTMADQGILVGMMTLNVTDGSSGQITAVSGSTFTVTLAGGTNNTWAIGDSFTVLAGEYGVVTSWTNDEKYLFTAEIGGMVDVSTIVNNVYLEFVRRPLPLQFDTQKPEIPPDLHEFLADYVVWYLKRTAPKGSNDFNEAQAGIAAFDAGMGLYIDLDSTLEGSGETSYYDA